MIYHVTTYKLWEAALKNGYYEAPSLHSKGFIHISTQQQINGVLNRYYKDQKALLLLHIDEEKVSSPLKWELAPSVNEEFPHIYGKLNLAAVIKVSNILAGNYEL
jgi:uncharacterized protein (DUF952 family)